MRAWLRRHEGNWKAALADYSNGNELSDDPHEFALNVWYCHVKMGDMTAVNKVLAAALDAWEANPTTDITSKWKQGIARMLSGKLDSTAVEQMVQTETSELKQCFLCDLQFHLGVKVLASGNKADARKHFQAAAEMKTLADNRSTARWELEELK